MIICQYNLLFDGQRSSSFKLSIKLQLDLFSREMNNLDKYMEQLWKMHAYFSLVRYGHKGIVWLTKWQTNIL